MSIKRIDVICLSVVVLITLITGCLIGYSWIEKNRQDLQKKELISRRSDELKTAERNMQYLREALALERKTLASIDERVPDSTEIGNFLRQLNTLAEKNQVGLISINPLAPLKDDYFTRVPIHMVCKGSFNRIYGLLHDLEQMKRAMVMERITISRPNITEACHLDLTAAILQREEART
jgi:Tfp pilus assembly protein PilO